MPHLVPLLGDLITAGKKERAPLQAADVLLWHLRRAEAAMLGVDD